MIDLRILGKELYLWTIYYVIGCFLAMKVTILFSSTMFEKRLVGNALGPIHGFSLQMKILNSPKKVRVNQY
ncbi:hypothetical protein VNO77_01070 [Canavalia gladiata]|uniref:Uncharacterized protein n=1 Tax=Canavalia gladiata TaxID=3824 RepID=A0AAN9MV88_CANGL